MKTISDNLFLLIKSMTKHEKRYFKVFSSKHVIGKENKYLKVFDVIDSFEEYDEAAIKKKFKNEVFIKQFFVIKNYLYDIILNSLDSYHANKSISAEMKKIIHYAEILYNKGLYEQSEKMLDKAEKLADKFTNELASLEVLLLKMKILKTRSFAGVSEEEISTIFRYKLSLTKNIEKQINYQWAYMCFNQKLLKKGWGYRSKWELETEYLPLINNEYFKVPASSLTIHSRIYYHNTLCLFEYISGNEQKCYEHAEALSIIFENNRELMLNRIDEYYTALNSIIWASILAKKHEEAFKNIAKLKNLPVSSSLFQSKIIVSAFLPELIIYNSTDGFKKGVKGIPEIEKKLVDLNGLISKSDLFYFYYNFVCLYFKSELYPEALNYLNIILNDDEIKSLPDMQSNAVIMNILVHFELKNYDLLPYLIRSAIRQEGKQNNTLQFKKVVLNHIKILSEKVSEKDIVQSLIELDEKLKELGKNPYERKTMEFFGIQKWINKRIGTRVRRS